MELSEKKFTWVQTYKELVNYLAGKENDQKGLIEILDKAGVQSLIDENPKGNRIKLEEIDPFSFFCFINKYGSERRSKIFQNIAKELKLHVPEDDSGLPSVQGMKVMMFPFKYDRTENEISRLWQFFYSALNDSISEEQFADIVKINGVGLTKLTECLFYIRPYTYFPIDGPTRPYLKKMLGINPKFKTWAEYLLILKQIKEKRDQPFYDLSHEAYLWNKEQNMARYWLFQGNPSLFDVEQALKDKALTSWRVNAHKEKIKPGDKVIIWASGERRGCYALSEVESDVYEDIVSEGEFPYYHEAVNGEPFDQVELRITHNLAENPITYDQINEVEALTGLNIGNQGTNFTATKEEFETLLDMAEQPQGNTSKWNELVDVVIRIDNESAVRNFFKFLQKVLLSLDSNGKEEVIYASAIDKYIQLTIGSRYVSKIEWKRTGTHIGYYIQELFLQDLKVNYPDIIVTEKVNDVDGNPMVWVKTDADEVKPQDFLNAALSVAKSGFTGQSKSQYHAIHPGVHNPWIAKVALNDSLLEKLIHGKKMKETTAEISYPLNTIFYGPPGTGKTYNTIKRAAEIVKGRIIQDFDEAKQIFNSRLGDTIEFITFHQNYSYEDFIEGLRPDLEGGDQLSFKRSIGVFKRLSDRALNNYKESKKAPQELNKKMAFDDALEAMKEKILENSDKVRINETAYFIGVEDDAFRYTADNWTLDGKGFNGFRMKYSDLLQFFENGVKNRKDVKDLSEVSGLAKQHASYFFKTYQIIKNMMTVQATHTLDAKKNNYVLIIDEINRANISRVFGELITLIDSDKRYGRELHIPARLPSGEKFSVPENLYIIGTMNTADKSIALLDIALRRRFEFEAMYPKYIINGEKIDDSDVLEKINERIIKLKGHDFQIGHSYFMKNHISLEQRMNRKVIPLLLEYFMNNAKEVREILAHAGLKIKEGENIWPLEITGRA